MGTTCMRDPGSYAAEKREMERLLSWQDDQSCSAELVQLSKVSSTWYGAVRFTGDISGMITDYEPEKPDELTIAVIVKTSRYQGEFCYKEMTEMMGPTPELAKAPLGLLKKLSPVLHNSYAAQWRHRCGLWANRPTPKPGQTVRLAAPVSFQGQEFRELTCIEHRRGYGPVYSLPGIGRGRLRAENLVGAEVISA